MPKISPAKYASNSKWNKRNYETVSAKAYRAERLNDLIRIAAARQHTSAAAYILQAIRQQLQRDGVRLDDLPPITSTDDDSTSTSARNTRGEVSYYPMA